MLVDSSYARGQTRRIQNDSSPWEFFHGRCLVVAVSPVTGRRRGPWRGLLPLYCRRPLPLTLPLPIQIESSSHHRRI